ncbi:MAG: PA2169 family four-helix-bundle protein [Chitinophagales bacterium]|nr:PA2169 family four-helix-bundle protein [Chitinophagales bacterium]
MKTNEKITDVLNTLVQINNDRIEGYEHAAKETEDSDLKQLFNGMAAKSQMMNGQLITEVLNCGGKPTESTTTSGKVFRVWMDFKSILTGKDRKAILSLCEFGEDAAQDTYEAAIKESNELPSHIIRLITDQKTQLLQDHNRVKTLRNSEVISH